MNKKMTEEEKQLFLESRFSETDNYLTRFEKDYGDKELLQKIYKQMFDWIIQIEDWDIDISSKYCFNRPEELSFFFVLAYAKINAHFVNINKIYDFKENCAISKCLENELSGSENEMLKLAFHLFNKKHSFNLTDGFNRWDEKYQIMAYTAIQIKFDHATTKALAKKMKDIWIEINVAD